MIKSIDFVTQLQYNSTRKVRLLIQDADFTLNSHFCNSMSENGRSEYENMKQFFEKIGAGFRNFTGKAGYGLQRFMIGRHGIDEFYVFVNVVITALLILLLITKNRVLAAIALVLVGYNLFRSLSKNGYKRQRELDAYLKVKNKVTSFFKLVKNMWRDRKTHRYYACPACKARVRISKPPKGKKISITCPKCGNSFIKKT